MPANSRMQVRAERRAAFDHRALKDPATPGDSFGFLRTAFRRLSTTLPLEGAHTEQKTSPKEERNPLSLAVQ